ncbi:MAG: hypothetical protein OHK0013_21430 [Sandaracinaceae bacterium]
MAQTLVGEQLELGGLLGLLDPALPLARVSRENLHFSKYQFAVALNLGPVGGLLRGGAALLRHLIG